MQGKNKAKYCKFWFPALVYSGIIFWVSSIPKLQAPIEGLNVDKILHIGEYIPFGFLVAYGFVNTKSSLTRTKIVYLSALIALGYGITDEIHQMFVEGRHSSGFDVLADTIGGLIGGYIFCRINKPTNDLGRK